MEKENNFNFGIGSTEVVDLEFDNALAEHFQSSEDVAEIKTEVPKAPPSKAKPSQIEETKEEVISDKELETSLLSALEEKTEEAKEETPETNLEETSDVSQYVDTFYKIGILTGGEQEIKTEEDLIEALRQEKIKGAEEELNNFLTSKGDKATAWFKAVMIDGVDPNEYFSISKSIDSVKEVNMEDVNVQRSLVRRLLTEHSNFSPEKADKYIKVIEADGDLDKEAVSAQEQLLGYEEKELSKRVAQKEKEENYKKQEANVYVNNVHAEVSKYLKVKEVDGLPFTDKIAQQTYNYMTTKTHTLKSNGDQLSSFDVALLELRKPENIEKALKIALLMQNDFDFTKIKKKAVSEEKTKFFSTHAKKEKEVARKPFDQFKIEI